MFGHRDLGKDLAWFVSILILVSFIVGGSTVHWVLPWLRDPSGTKSAVVGAKEPKYDVSCDKILRKDTTIRCLETFKLGDQEPRSNYPIHSIMEYCSELGKNTACTWKEIK